jgi:hypothetical protein
VVPWRLGSGPDGSNSLWRFINSKVKSTAASFDVSGKVRSDPQEVANAFAETFKLNFQRPQNLFPLMRRKTGVDATSVIPELSELHISVST